MRLPAPPANATRFFARPLAGILECPRCGQILSFSNTGKRRRGSTKGWNPQTSELTCWDCGKSVVIGLIAWPVLERSHGRTLPRDQVPNERQLAQMRNMEGLGPGGAGWWMPKDQALKARRVYHSNITTGCNCGENSDGTPKRPPSHNCPIHGDHVPGSEGWETRGDH